MTADAESRPARRHDPHRADRIVDAALDVIAEHGVPNTTHRLIAAAADVPLGSLTYHFTSLEELRARAFTRHAERMADVYEAHFSQVEDVPDLVEAVTALVHGDAGADEGDVGGADGRPHLPDRRGGVGGRHGVSRAGPVGRTARATISRVWSRVAGAVDRILCITSPSTRASTPRAVVGSTKRSSTLRLRRIQDSVTVRSAGSRSAARYSS